MASVHLVVRCTVLASDQSIGATNHLMICRECSAPSYAARSITLGISIVSVVPDVLQLEQEVVGEMGYPEIQEAEETTSPCALLVRWSCQAAA